MNSLLKKVLLRTFGFSLLVFLSPLLFIQVEYTEKDDNLEKYQLLSSLYKSMESKYNMSLEEFNKFCSVAYEALSMPKPKWTYIHAFDFIVQTVTTIGYGYITPQTPEGQILCIFVSLLGIPITLLTLNSVGELIAKLISKILTKFERKFLGRPEPKHVKIKTAAILGLSMITIMMVCGTVSVMRQEGRESDWTFVEALYFWFITSSTIGFGDYVFYPPSYRIKKLTLLNSTYQGNENAESFQAFHIPSSLFFVTIYMFSLSIVCSVINSIMAAIEESKCYPRCVGCFTNKTRDFHENTEQHGQNHAAMS